MAVVPLSKFGKFDNSMPKIIGHTGAIFDCDFNPFHDQIIATGSDDCSCKVWGIPTEDGLTEDLKEPLVDLNNHMKKVTFTQFHPCANNGRFLCSLLHCNPEHHICGNSPFFVPFFVLSMVPLDLPSFLKISLVSRMATATCFVRFVFPPQSLPLDPPITPSNSGTLIPVKKR